MGAGRRRAMLEALTPRLCEDYVPHVPHPPQQLFLLLSQVLEVFYGGAGGGGKSDALLIAALQYVDVPGYSALIIRRNFKELSLPGALMDRAGQWLRGTSAKPVGGGVAWEFPTSDPVRPARLTFGYAQYHADTAQYQSAEFQYVAFDELTEFEERTYEFLFSRLRGPALPCANCGHGTSRPAGENVDHDEGHDDLVCECTAADPDRSALPAAPDGTTLADVPLRMRSASNPGGLGHLWVRDRFVEPATPSQGRVFIPARLEDNPSMDRRSYRRSLSHLGATTQRRIEHGDWDAEDEGEVFQRHWFEIVSDYPRDRRMEWCRFWDLAATAAARGKDPDWTVGALVGLDRVAGMWYVAGLRRLRDTPGVVEEAVVQEALLDRAAVPGVRTRMEQEPGSSGVNTIHTYRRLLAGLDFDGVRATGSKEERARPLSTAAQAGNVKLVDGPWVRGFLDEASGFPTLPHDDQVDAVASALAELAFGRRARLIA